MTIATWWEKTKNGSWSKETASRVATENDWPPITVSVRLKLPLMDVLGAYGRLPSDADLLTMRESAK